MSRHRAQAQLEEAEEGEGAAQQLGLEFGPPPSPHRNPDRIQLRGHRRKAVEKCQEPLARSAELFVDELSKVKRQRQRWPHRASPLTVANLPNRTQATPRPNPPLVAPLNLSFPSPPPHSPCLGALGPLKAVLAESVSTQGSHSFTSCLLQLSARLLPIPRLQPLQLRPHLTAGFSR